MERDVNELDGDGQGSIWLHPPCVHKGGGDVHYHCSGCCSVPLLSSLAYYSSMSTPLIVISSAIPSSLQLLRVSSPRVC